MDFFKKVSLKDILEDENIFKPRKVDIMKDENIVFHLTSDNLTSAAATGLGMHPHQGNQGDNLQEESELDYEK